jgi:DNA-binding transcriptional ArsR family regulator
MRRDIFQAIADPTRREIIHLIAYHPLNVNAVAERFDVSRTAIYKHIKILTECGLVVITPFGRERYCELKLEKLVEIADWAEQYRKILIEQSGDQEGFSEEADTRKKRPGRRK